MGRRKQINFQNISILTICMKNSENRGISGEMMVGGLGFVKERDADVDVVIAKVRKEIEAKAKAESVRVDEFSVISYATQVVAGTNYFVKIRLNKDDGGHVHCISPRIKPIDYIRMKDILVCFYKFTS